MLDNNHARVIVDSTSPIAPYKPELPRKRNITITLAISMNGAPLASQLLTHKTSVLDDYRSLEYHNVYLDSNDSGYQDNDTFLRYVKHALGPLLQLRTQSRFMSTPIVLLVDGHYSHKSEAFISWCRFSNILPIIPPPNTTQSVQPLDCGVNAVFKSKLQNNLDDALFPYAYYHFFFSFLSLRPAPENERPSGMSSPPLMSKEKQWRLCFSEAVGRALEDSLTNATIIHAFRSAGIYSKADMDIRLSSLPVDREEDGCLMSGYNTSDYILTEIKHSPSTRKEKRMEKRIVPRRKGLNSF